ncbi:hypothetical protein JOB18_016554 [Solea senegalensis]|uniref:Uncharacterized protein n=1 Tax=Solea senegalensis TaxID=28829 RepID=A0AAV6QVW9_SOLSE|nr:uncharacterized protein LOC122766753 [Solea senegalensis]KAG7496309.1 hypothetical protein JOB18_016554 [Solea senegalensis]
MSGSTAVYSRLELFAVLPVCVTVMLFVMCSDAASASLVLSHANSGMKHGPLSSLFTPYSQRQPLSTGLLPTETGLQTGTNGGREISRSSIEALSITEHRSNPLWITEGSSSYNQNRLDNGGIIRVYRGQSVDGVRPVSRIYTSHSQNSEQSFETPQSRLNYHPPSEKVAQTGYSYNSYPLIIGKSSQNEGWGPSNPQTSYHVHKNDRTAWASQPGGHVRTSLSTSRGHHGGYKETNELSAARPQNGFHSSKFSPSVRNGNNPGSERATSSITSFSQGLNSVARSDSLRPKEGKSYLFKDSSSSYTPMPQKPRASDAQGHRTLESKWKQSHKKDPIKGEDAKVLHFNTNSAWYGGQTGFSTYPPAQLSQGRTTKENFVPLATSQKKSASIREKYAAGSPVNTSTISTKNIYSIRTFTNPPQLANPSIRERTNSRPYSFDKEKDNMFKFAHKYPSLSPKYSFGQKRAWTPTVTPAKLERTPTENSQTVSTARLFKSRLKNVQPLLPESDAAMNSGPDHRQSRISRLYGLKGFGTRPLEGARTSLRESDKSVTPQRGPELRSSQTWQPRSSQIYRKYIKTGEMEPENSNISTQTQNELSTKGFIPYSAGGTESAKQSTFTPNKFQKNHNIYTFRGFNPAQTRIKSAYKKTDRKYNEQHPTVATLRVSASYLRSAGGLNKTKPVPGRSTLFNRASSSTVRGKRVRVKQNMSNKLNESTIQTSKSVDAAIVRLPKHPHRANVVTYADILGSASFAGVRATTQTPITPPDKDSFPSTTAVTGQKEGARSWTPVKNTSRAAEAKSEDEAGDFSRVEEKEMDLELGRGMKTFDAPSDNEGSGSGAFNLPDVVSADSTKSPRLSEDLLELDYLRISTGNISFKSMKLSESNAEK